MSPATTLGLYAGGLALVFAAALAIGDAVGPVGTTGAATPTHSTPDHSDPDHSGPDHSDPSSSDTATRFGPVGASHGH